nr:MOSC domain-containing protein [Lewinella sp. JB7]
MHEDVDRPVDPRYARNAERVSFADGYPYLITTTASLQDLSRHYGESLDPRRFRPNIIVETTEPYTEDHWSVIEVGNHAFYLPKPCARCVMITNDPDNGQRDPAVMRQLAAHRKVGNKVLFGMNAIWKGGAGDLRVGDMVTAIT